MNITSSYNEMQIGNYLQKLLKVPNIVWLGLVRKINLRLIKLNNVLTCVVVI